MIVTCVGKYLPRQTFQLDGDVFSRRNLDIEMDSWNGKRVMQNGKPKKQSVGGTDVIWQNIPGNKQ